MANAAASTGKPPGKANLLVTVAALTVLAAVGGGLVGKLIVAAAHAPAAPEPAAAKALSYGGDVDVRELPPIVTNLAAPSGIRVRLQVSLVYAKKDVENPALLMGQVSDDLVAFLKTLTLTQIEGASGLQSLREDLNERAAVRSQGKVRELVIETLVVQ